MTTWFTSDLHLHHRAMAYFRRYGHWPADKSQVTDQDVLWHNDLLARNWDTVVGMDDQVWVLGDLTANEAHLPKALQWIQDRPGTKHLILGNHDPAHPIHRESHKWLPKYFADEAGRVFSSVQSAARRRVTLTDGTRQDVLLSHFPYEGDGDSRPEDRDTQWRLRNEGLPILHGHTHTDKKLTWVYAPTNGEFPTIPQVHVGLDAWDYTPMSLQQVTELLDTAEVINTARTA